jgi:hypothetical protein
MCTETARLLPPRRPITPTCGRHYRAVSAVGAELGALTLRALGMLPRSNGEQMSCPICGGATRFHKPYLMCDECKSFAGVRISGKDYASR